MCCITIGLAMNSAEREALSYEGSSQDVHHALKISILRNNTDLRFKTPSQQP